MLNRLKLIQEVIQAFHEPIVSSGWAPSATDQRFSELEEAVVLTLVRRAFSDSRLERKSLLEFVHETRKLFSWEDGSREELELVLSTLLFAYDKGLMVYSKKLLTKRFDELDNEFQASLNENVKKNSAAGAFDQPPEAPSHLGLSLVLTYSYPQEFETALQKTLQPVGDAKTVQPHFTILNVGLNIPKEKLDAILDHAAARIRTSIEEDYALCGLLQRLLRWCSIRSEIRVMRTGDIVLFGTGIFSKVLHQIRLRLLTGILPLEVGVAFGNDRRNIWTHTVYTRLKEQIAGNAPTQLQTNYSAFEAQYHYGGEDDPGRMEIKLERPQLELLAFADKKAIYRPFDRRLVLEVGSEAAS